MRAPPFIPWPQLVRVPLVYLLTSMNDGVPDFFLDLTQWWHPWSIYPSYHSWSHILFAHTDVLYYVTWLCNDTNGCLNVCVFFRSSSVQFYFMKNYCSSFIISHASPEKSGKGAIREESKFFRTWFANDLPVFSFASVMQITGWVEKLLGKICYQRSPFYPQMLTRTLFSSRIRTSRAMENLETFAETRLYTGRLPSRLVLWSQVCPLPINS